MPLIKLGRSLRLLLVAPVIFLFLAMPVQAEFSISGKLYSLKQGAKLQLLREDLDARTQTLEGVIEVRADHSFASSFDAEPGLFSLALPGGQTVALALDMGQSVSLAEDASSPGEYSVTGSPDTKVLQAYEVFRKDSLVRLVYPPRAVLNKAVAAGIPIQELGAEAQAEVDGYNAHRRELNDFTINRAGTSIALYATSLRWDGDYRIDEIQKKVETFASEHPGLAITHSMQERLRLFSLTAIGVKGVPISGKNLDGETFSLEDFRGKYVLIDFWASWCGPCRVENRHYPKLLEKYSKNGFEVFGINLDSNRTIWDRTTKQDGVTWPQVSDLLGLKSPLAQAYNVSALPISFLLDEEGRIIAKNLRGEALAKKLQELFGDHTH